MSGRVGMAENGTEEVAVVFNLGDSLELDAVPPQIGRQENEGGLSEGEIKEKKPGMLKSLRGSLRRVGEKMSPLTSQTEGSKGKADTRIRSHHDPHSNLDAQTLKPPPSPVSSIGSPLHSPLRNLSGLFQSHQSPKSSHSRTQSDSAIGETLLKKGASIRRSLRLGSKKEKLPKQGPLKVVKETTAPTEEKIPEVPEKFAIRDSYTLPEIPPVPLSVMQINKLIEMEVLEEAYLNLLSLRLEFQHEMEALDGDASSMELAHKEKDLSLLYGSLKNKLYDIVRQSLVLPSRNKELLVHVARIIQEEGRREREPGAMGGWQEAWRDAIRDSMRDTLDGLHLEGSEQNASWLAVHLGLLGKAIVEDLERVKLELQGSYPPSFKAFETYVMCCHEVVGQHVKKLLGKVAELRDHYTLLDFILHRYQSEKIMGSISLRPEIKEEQRALPLEKGFLEELRCRYCDRLKVDMWSSLERVIDLEYEDMWRDKRRPETDEDLYISHLPMDIWTNIKGHIQGSSRIDSGLEIQAARVCLEELRQFPIRFEAQFRQWSGTLSEVSLWMEYHITYINSFCALKEHMEEYRLGSPSQVDQLGREIDGLVLRLGQALLEQFKDDIKPFLRRMMTRKWLSNDEDFDRLMYRIECLSEKCKHMTPPQAQSFVNDMHYHVVKEYISQLMKNNYSCKNRKNERAATKMKDQWTRLKEIFQEIHSTLDWLHPAGDHLSKIIGHRNKSDIKDELQPLIDDYPDFSKRHLTAVLFFRGMIRGRERQLTLQRFSEIQKNLSSGGSQKRAFFSEIQTASNTDCLADTPLSCLSFLIPDN